MMNKNVFVLFLMVVFSCETLDSTYDDFVKDGVTIYVEKPKEPKLHGGDKRAVLSWVILSDPNVEKYKIYWNNNTDSLENVLEESSGRDTVEVLLESLDEKFYQFEILLFDKYGNSSLKATSLGFVYGDFYRESIKNLNRTFKDINPIDNSNDYEIVWTDSKDETLLYSIVSFRDTTNKDVQKRIASSSELDTLRAVASGQEITIQTAFLPDTLALDTFFTEMETLDYID